MTKINFDVCRRCKYQQSRYDGGPIICVYAEAMKLVRVIKRDSKSQHEDAVTIAGQYSRTYPISGKSLTSESELPDECVYLLEHIVSENVES